MERGFDKNVCSQNYLLKSEGFKAHEGKWRDTFTVVIAMLSCHLLGQGSRETSMAACMCPRQLCSDSFGSDCSAAGGM